TRTEWVASVGNQRISKQDVELRLEMVKLVNPKATQKEALDQLINYKVGNYILESMGQRISQQDVADQMEKLKTEGKTETKIATVLRNYQRNHSFSELFLYPRLVESKIRSLYENDKAFHDKEWAAASMLLVRAKADPAKLETIAAEMGVPFLQGQFNDLDKNIQWDPGRGLASSGINLPKEPWFATKLTNEVLSKTESGKIYPEVKTLWFGYLVLRKDPSEKTIHSFSVAVAPRKALWQWMNQKSFLIPVTKYDGSR
ncbi:hypothetical protein EBT16_13610, partial [bacterium]|nr:hypothetical protein [bacterium]